MMQISAISITMKSISDILRDIDEEFTSENVSVSALLDAFHERGFGFFLFLFALPAALPLPAVGYGTVLGLPLVLLSAQQAMGRKTIWLPGSWKARSIRREKLKSIIDRALPWTKRLEYIIRPRLEFVTSGFFLRMIGVFALVMALSVCVPLPLTNTVPSFGIALMSIGVITRDGLAVLVGAIIGMLWVCALVFIIGFLGTEGIVFVKELIKGDI
ncbi:MAG: exopolysaccharide biosynthesis protein [Alphaproteobacteria bacterium]|nr:exopolysaccharide biosynthesis protein [Alphaproteobacteria bacterium]